MKEAYYFSHDSNARHDPKITVMRGVYGSEGYGWFWMFIEMMRETDGYKLDMHSKYAFHAYAMQMQCESIKLAQFVHDCINEFDLFESDGMYFWSPSLLKRMEKKGEKADKARKAAEARWAKKEETGEDDAKPMQTHDPSIADATENDALKESKVNKDIYIAQFDIFWDLYPNKKGKQKAREKWISYGDRIDIEQVLQGTRKYIQYCKATNRIYKDGSTFVNNQSWSDDWTIPSVTTIRNDSTRYSAPQEKEAEMQKLRAERDQSSQEVNYAPRWN
jgi:hypothetical protein